MGGVASCHMVVKVESHPHRPDPNAWRLHQSVGAAQSVPRSYLCACGERVGKASAPLCGAYAISIQRRG